MSNPSLAKIHLTTNDDNESLRDKMNRRKREKEATERLQQWKDGVCQNTQQLIDVYRSLKKDNPDLTTEEIIRFVEVDNQPKSYSIYDAFESLSNSLESIAESIKESADQRSASTIAVSNSLDDISRSIDKGDS